MTRTNIRVIENSEWSEYRDIRLAALKDSPNAFGSTFERASTFPDQEWKKRCEHIDLKKECPLVATINGHFIGIVWAIIDQPENTICNIYQMWVSPEHRGLSLGRALLVHSIDWARSRNVESIQLSVTCGNSLAQRLYESIGFLAYGEPEPLREGSKVMIQSMAL